MSYCKNTPSPNTTFDANLVKSYKAQRHEVPTSSLKATIGSDLTPLSSG